MNKTKLNKLELLLLPVLDAFPQAYCTENNELVIYADTNTFFNLRDIDSKLDMDERILEYCSREASDSINQKSLKYHRDGIINYFNRTFKDEELIAIYTFFGNGLKPHLCRYYIENKFDLNILIDLIN